MKFTFPMLKMNKIFNIQICAVAVAIFSPYIVSAGNLTLANDGVSNYQIVLPDGGKSERIDSYLREAANMIRHCFKEATGAELPVVKESGLSPGKPGIFLGNTKAASDAGIDVKTMEDWEYAIKSSGKNILITGSDRPGPRSQIRSYAFNSLGTVIGVTEFLGSYLNAHFLMPGFDGMQVQKKKNVVVSDDINIRIKPLFDFCTGGNREMFYDLSNNFFPAVNYGTYGGHSHNVAIPPEKYMKTNPEYFILINGKRLNNSKRPQYCISNPQVQELIYQELLNHCDQGYDIVQLGQSDGFTPCQCEKCINLFGIIPNSKPGTRESYKDPAWGEKLWIIHRSMAERLLKDRPNKKVAIMAYGPTVHPPKTFKDFPSNVIVELAHYDDAAFVEWRGMKVPNAYFVYIYNWGQYHVEGYMPKRTPDFVVEQVRRFRKNNVKGIYRCGFGESFGLEGPVYCLYGKLLANPDIDTGQVLDEYYEYAYGPAMKPMKEFFNLLYRRLKLDLNRNEDWNDPDLLNGTLPSNVSEMDANIQIMLMRYPENVIAKMEAYLEEAGKLVPAGSLFAKRLLVSRIEFQYLKLTAGTANIFSKYLNSPSRENFTLVSDSVGERIKFIDSLKFSKEKEPRVMPSGTIPLFGSDLKSTLLIGGRLGSPLKAPFDWDFNYLKKNDILPGKRVLEISPGKDSGDTQVLLPPSLSSISEEDSTKVNCRCDNNFLYITFICEKSDMKEIEEDRFVAVVAPDGTGSRQLQFYLQGKSKLASVRKIDKKSCDNDWKGDIYKDFPSKLKVEVSARQNQNNNSVSIGIAVPLELFDSAKPSLGQTWYGNFLRTRKTPSGDYVWEPNIIRKTWQNKLDELGKITFK